MKIVQLACWCAALVIVVITVAVFMFEMNDDTGAHALPAGVSIDSIFSLTQASPSMIESLDPSERSVLAKLCTDTDLERRQALFASVMRDSPVFAAPLVPQRGYPFELSVIVASVCTNALIAAQSAAFGADDLRALPRAALLAVLVKLKELGYGENDEVLLRTVIAALRSGSTFPRNVFLDLGSGRGKMLAVACTQLDSSGAYLFDECIGVEGVAARLQAANELYAQFQQAVAAAGAGSVVQRLSSSVSMRAGDLRSAQLANELFPRVTHFYVDNAVFDVDLDSNVARHIAANARPGVRIALHTHRADAWPANKFRVVQRFEAFTLVEVF